MRPAILILLSALPIAGGQLTPERLRYPDRPGTFLKGLHQSAVTGAPYSWQNQQDTSFEHWQKRARKRLRELIGLNQMEKNLADLQPSVRMQPEKIVTQDGHSWHRAKGVLRPEPEVEIPFWMLTPVNNGITQRPLAICAHGHDTDGWNTYAGVYRDNQHRDTTLAKDGDIAVQAVKQGYVCLVPATRGLAAAAAIPDLNGRHGNRACRAQLIHSLLAGRTAIGERVWDVQRLLDWALENLIQIDRSRILMTGNSGGGVLTAYTAALDERVTVAIPSCSFTAATSRTGYVFHCDCCVVPGLQSELGGFPELGGLIAPRALLTVHGKKDGLHSHDDVQRAMAHVEQLFRAAGGESHFLFQWGEQGHQFYPERMWPFVTREFDID